MRRHLVLALTTFALLASGCASSDDDDNGASTDTEPRAAADSTSPSTAASTDHDGHEGEDGHGGHDGQHRPGGHGSGAADHASAPLRAGEQFIDLTMPAAYTPSAPYGSGTDDYRCFLLDPRLATKQFVTGVDVLPGNPESVHHVILFRVPPDQVDEAEAQDADEDGQGWTCFGGTGVDADLGGDLDAAPWIGAWAPGGGESLLSRDIGIPLDPGSRLIMQVHYNLLAGSAPDVSSTRLRVAPGSADLAPLQTVLLPAPVELSCRPTYSDGPLCERQAAIADVMDRFGEDSGWMISGLQLLCGGATDAPESGEVQHCDRPVSQRMTVRAVGGHMHLLGKQISVEVNPGRPDARMLLDIPVWDFDDQAAIPLRDPAVIEPGDTLRVTCRHSQELRDMLPSFEGQPDRYVVWGDGTTDEMCLGILLVTRAP